MSLHCFEKQDFNKFSQEQKSRVKKKVAMVKEYEWHEKNQILLYPRTINILTCKESKLSNLLYH